MAGLRTSCVGRVKSDSLAGGARVVRRVHRADAKLTAPVTQLKAPESNIPFVADYRDLQLKPNLLAGLIALSLTGCMTPAVLRDPSTGEIVQCLATGAFPIINQQQCIAAHEGMGWIRTTGAEARRASQQQLAQRNTEVTAAIEECRAARMRGELKSYAEAAQCANVRIRAVNQSASYPFMDLVDLAAAVRLADAEKVDKHQMSEAEAALHVAQVKSMVPREIWCDNKHSSEERAEAGVGTGFFSKLFGR